MSQGEERFPPSAAELLTTPLPAFSGPDDFEAWISVIDRSVENSDPDIRLALSGLRATAGEVIGKRLSDRRRYFFNLGDMIGTHGYTDDLHALIGNYFFLGKEDQASMEGLLGLFQENPRDYILGSLIVDEAGQKKILGTGQQKAAFRLYETFSASIKQKPAEEVGGWLESYLGVEAELEKTLADPEYTFAYLGSDKLESMYDNGVLGVLTDLEEGEDADFEHIDALTTDLMHRADGSQRLTEKLQNLAVDIARAATNNTLLQEGNKMMGLEDLIKTLETGELTPFARVSTLSNNTNIAGRAIKQKTIVSIPLNIFNQDPTWN